MQIHSSHKDVFTIFQQHMAQIHLLPKLHQVHHCGTWSICSPTKQQLGTYSMADYYYATCLYDAFSHGCVLYSHIHTFLLVCALMLCQNTKQRAQLQPPLVLRNSMTRNENSYNWTSVSVPNMLTCMYQTTKGDSRPSVFTASVKCVTLTSVQWSFPNVSAYTAVTISRVNEMERGSTQIPKFHSGIKDEDTLHFSASHALKMGTVTYMVTLE